MTVLLPLGSFTTIPTCPNATDCSPSLSPCCFTVALAPTCACTASSVVDATHLASEPLITTAAMIGASPAIKDAG